MGAEGCENPAIEETTRVSRLRQNVVVDRGPPGAVSAATLILARM